jgi:DNA end-binding protein Ku
MVMIEPRGAGMALFTSRAADEVRAPQFRSTEGHLDTEMVAIAEAIIRQRTGTFDPSTYRDRDQEALRELIEAKMRGLTIKPRPVVEPSPVIDLMAGLKHSLAREAHTKGSARKEKRTKAIPDRRQPSLLLPVSSGRKRKEELATEPTAIATRRSKRA